MAVTPKIGCNRLVPSGTNWVNGRKVGVVINCGTTNLCPSCQGKKEMAEHLRELVEKRAIRFTKLHPEADYQKGVRDGIDKFSEYIILNIDEILEGKGK